jgi:hypothetical protein
MEHGLLKDGEKGGKGVIGGDVGERRGEDEGKQGQGKGRMSSGGKGREEMKSGVENGRENRRIFQCQSQF